VLFGGPDDDAEEPIPVDGFALLAEGGFFVDSPHTSCQTEVKRSSSFSLPYKCPSLPNWSLFTVSSLRRLLLLPDVDLRPEVRIAAEERRREELPPCAVSTVNSQDSSAFVAEVPETKDDDPTEYTLLPRGPRPPNEAESSSRGELVNDAEAAVLA
jgi:hypothetical protein